MRKLYAVALILFVIVVSIHAQNTKDQKLAELLNKLNTNTAQQPASQPNSEEPLIAFRIYEKGLILSMQGQSDEACKWDDDSNRKAKFSKEMNLRVWLGHTATLTGGLFDGPGLKCTFVKQNVGTLD